MYHNYTDDDFKQLEAVLSEAMRLLWTDDITLFELFGDPTDADPMERKLHEVCINHRLAVHIENNLPVYELDGYFVDIEYNRYLQGQKGARRNLTEAERIVRPDIIVHKRADVDNPIAHYLVIEAKKDQTSVDDIDKIERLMMDDRYKYKFGLTVQYLSDPDYVVGCIYYYDQIIRSKPIKFPKRQH